MAKVAGSAAPSAPAAKAAPSAPHILAAPKPRVKVPKIALRSYPSYGIDNAKDNWTGQWFDLGPVQAPSIHFFGLSTPDRPEMDERRARNRRKMWWYWRWSQTKSKKGKKKANKQRVVQRKNRSAGRRGVGLESAIKPGEEGADQAALSPNPSAVGSEHNQKDIATERSRTAFNLATSTKMPRSFSSVRPYKFCVKKV